MKFNSDSCDFGYHCHLLPVLTMMGFSFVADFLRNHVMVMEKVRIFIYQPVFHRVVSKRQLRFASRFTL